MKKTVSIKPGCITCGVCEFIAPEVFTVTDICHVRPGVEVELNEPLIESAIQACPVQVIQYDDK